MVRAVRLFLSDARHFQILFLGCFLIVGLARFGIDFTVTHAVAGLGAGLLTQYLFTRDEGFDPRSALISCLSLCLLLRTGDPILTAAAASLAIGSKFVFRVGTKPFFNPT
ncbi:MAG: Na+-transporting NADH:ubiquinone oxidoreductase, subunit NqrB, partial [Alphaproteobacteria bacterium]|nr:Na+-transporting NADH:ubiquinone oxidoreductase, subunit NqrB [Alphaproteobacteria bacterium]